MVHVFSYSKKFFLWDTESGSLSEIDYAAYLCVKNRYGLDLLPAEKTDYELLESAAKFEIENALISMEKEGSLNVSPIIKEFSKDFSTLKALCLHICHDCNLRCEYCFAHDGTYNTARDYMTFEVGQKAIDLLIKNSKNRTNLEIDFFGGEPLLNFDVVKKIVEYAKTEGEKHNKKFSFTMTTNCLMLSDEIISYLNEEMDNIVLSIDGRREINNAVRKTPNNKDVYDIIVKNALKMVEARGDKKYFVRGTFTSKNLDFSKDIMALNDLGFANISVEPVVLNDADPLSIKEEHLDTILKEYEIFAEEFAKRKKSGKNIEFFHFYVDLEHGPCANKRLTGCGAGTEYLAVSPVGDIYPCHRFVGSEGYKIGTVFEGLGREDLRKSLACNTVLTKKHCENCSAKYFCGGGCMANALEMCGKLDGQYKVGCEMTKKRFELALALNALAAGES